MAENNSSDDVNLYAELGMTNERAHEICIEIRTIRKESEKIKGLVAAIPKGYDRESIIVGVFLAEIILDNDGRLLPRGSTTIISKVREKCRNNTEDDDDVQFRAELR